MSSFVLWGRISNFKSVRGDRFAIELGHSRYRRFVSAWEVAIAKD